MKTIHRANDGREFDDKEECQAYEEDQLVNVRDLDIAEFLDKQEVSPGRGRTRQENLLKAWVAWEASQEKS